MPKKAVMINTRYFLTLTGVKNFCSLHHLEIPTSSKKGSSMIQTSVRIIKDRITRHSGRIFLLKKTDAFSVTGVVLNKNTAPAIQNAEVTLYWTNTSSL